MKLPRRQKSRIARIQNTAAEVSKRIPSRVRMPDLSIPTLSRDDLPSMPSLPARPKRPALNARKRISRESSGDTPLLSLAGGLLLGLFVGIVVAVVLVSRSDAEESSNARQTGITLLPNRSDDQGQSVQGNKAGIG